MSTTVKRISLCLTQESHRQVEDLINRFGETQSQIIVRAIQLLHYSTRFPNISIDDYFQKKED